MSRLFKINSVLQMCLCMFVYVCVKLMRRDAKKGYAVVDEEGVEA